MIIGIGIDLIEIQRIRKAVEDKQRFLDKIFTKKEIELFDERQMNYSTIAANFAAKEAVAKALGTGIQFKWQAIEILRNEVGKPYVNLYDRADEIFNELGGVKIFVSISHNKKDCIANCIITGGDKDESRL